MSYKMARVAPTATDQPFTPPSGNVNISGVTPAGISTLRSWDPSFSSCFSRLSSLDVSVLSWVSRPGRLIGDIAKGQRQKLFEGITFKNTEKARIDVADAVKEDYYQSAAEEKKHDIRIVPRGHFRIKLYLLGESFHTLRPSRRLPKGN